MVAAQRTQSGPAPAPLTAAAAASSPECHTHPGDKKKKIDLYIDTNTNPVSDVDDTCEELGDVINTRNQRPRCHKAK